MLFYTMIANTFIFLTKLQFVLYIYKQRATKLKTKL